MLRTGLPLLLAFALFACADDPKGPSPDTELDDPFESSDTDSTDADADVLDPDANQAPSLARIGNRKARVGNLLQIQLEASDPEGDELSFTVFGNLPEGAKFFKHTQRFEWTAGANDLGKVVLLTFAVSDGQLDDRETIQLTVVSDDTQSPPFLEPVGDLFAAPGRLFSLQLQATDEDGDLLTYSATGLPAEADFDSERGRLEWTPSDEDRGTTFELLFSVSDGTATSSADARLIVEEPPFDVAIIPPQTAILGEKLVLVLPVNNPNDLPYSCSMSSPPRPGASFVDCTLRYTPTDPALVNTTVDFVFSIESQGYSWLRRVTVSIRAADAACTPDVFEPNDSSSAAKPIEVGSHSQLSICADEDWYLIEVPADQSLRVELLFTHGPGSDLDLFVFAPTGSSPVAVSDGSQDNELAIVPQTVAGQYRIRVFEFSNAQASYAMNITLAPASCLNDSFEPNDTRNTAHFLGAAALLQVDDGMLCPGDEDWFSFDHVAGDSLSALLVFDASAGDLDLELYNPQGSLVAFSRRPLDSEEIALASLSPSGRYALRIYGYRNASAEYILEIEKKAAVQCNPDSFEPNDSMDAAKALPLGSHALSYCGDPDFFKLSVAASQRIRVRAQWSTPSSHLDFALLSSNGAIMLAASAPVSGGAELVYENDDVARELLLELADASLGLNYQLSFELLAAPCSAKTCAAGQVCADHGVCVSEACTLDANCPSAYRCRQGVCVDPCYVASDCRTQFGYACRMLSVADVVPFCAPSGTAGTGDACGSMAQCGPELACLTGAGFPNGSCAEIGCASDADCDFDSTCVQQSGAPLCLYYCFESADCRFAEGYQCLDRAMVGASGNVEVCVAP